MHACIYVWYASACAYVSVQNIACYANHVPNDGLCRPEDEPASAGFRIAWCERIFSVGCAEWRGARAAMAAGAASMTGLSVRACVGARPLGLEVYLHSVAFDSLPRDGRGTKVAVHRWRRRATSSRCPACETGRARVSALRRESPGLAPHSLPSECPMQCAA